VTLPDDAREALDILDTGTVRVDGFHRNRDVTPSIDPVLMRVDGRDHAVAPC